MVIKHVHEFVAEKTKLGRSDGSLFGMRAARGGGEVLFKFK